MNEKPERTVEEIASRITDSDNCFCDALEENGGDGKCEWCLVVEAIRTERQKVEKLEAERDGLLAERGDFGSAEKVAISRLLSEKNECVAWIEKAIDPGNFAGHRWAYLQEDLRGFLNRVRGVKPDDSLNPDGPDPIEEGDK